MATSHGSCCYQGTCWHITWYLSVTYSLTYPSSFQGHQETTGTTSDGDTTPFSTTTDDYRVSEVSSTEDTSSSTEQPTIKLDVYRNGVPVGEGFYRKADGERVQGVGSRQVKSAASVSTTSQSLLYALALLSLSYFRNLMWWRGGTFIFGRNWKHFERKKSMVYSAIKFILLDNYPRNAIQVLYSTSLL